MLLDRAGGLGAGITRLEIQGITGQAKHGSEAQHHTEAVSAFRQGRKAQDLDQ